MAAAKPSSIPVPTASPVSSPAPPSPSAFPSLSGSSPSPTTASAPPSGIPSYAALSKKSLPPSKAPEGVSVPASALPKRDPSSSKERLQPSSAGRDSPYARPSANGANGTANGARTKKKSTTSKGPAGATGAAGRAKQVHAGQGQQSSAEESGAEKKERPRTVPGMPASMLPPPVPKKKAHGRTKSDVGLSQPASSSANGKADAADIPGLGKKRRASLKKVLPPGSSKLSALAASFDFIPRSATTPNLSSFSSSAEDDTAVTDTEEAPSPVSSLRPTASGETQHTSGALTPSFKELSLEAEDELEEGEIREEAPPSAAPSAAPSSPIKEDEKELISETVGSAGAQGDEFRAKSFETADEEGEEAAKEPKAGEQSATPEKPTSAGSAPEASKAEQKEDEKATLAPEPAQTGRTLGAFLDSAFADSHDGTAFAPLELPDELKPAALKEEEKPKVERIPSAVNVSPVADLAYVEKKGWWSPDYVPQYCGPLRLDASTSQERPNPEDAGPAAVEPAQAEASEVLLKLPAWQPPKKEVEDRKVRELADESAAAQLGALLGSAFTERADLPTSAEAVASSSSFLPPASSSAPLAASSAPAADSPSLASYLSTSFAPLAATGFAPLGEIRAEALDASSRVESDLPTTAEEVANLPSSEERLEEAAEQAEGAKDKKGEKYGWWSEGYVAPKEEGLVDQEKVRQTVQTAGAQADGFIASSFSQADREGAKEVEGKKAGEQSLPKEDKVEEKSSAPALGSFLASSFSATDVPSTSSFPSPSALETADRLVPTSLTSGTVRSAGAQGDAFVGRSFTAADRVGEVEEHKTAERDAHGSNALGQYLTTAFAGEGHHAGETPAVEVSSSSSAANDEPAAASSSASAPAAVEPSTSSGADEPRRPSGSGDKDAPSLTLAVRSAWHTAPWSRKLWAVIASLAINVGLPFVNGVMLGFGELFARNVLGVRLGWPLHSSSPTVPATGRANTSGVGLRSAGTRVGTEVPGHAAAKTAVEAVAETAAQ
ncbi:hypothetical protein JCM8097_001785 [Rhodosporidiobolus ruineniae]